MKNRCIVIYIVLSVFMLVLGIYLSYSLSYRNAPKKAVSQFLQYLMEKDTAYSDYLVTNLEDHDFIRYIGDHKITDFKILNTDTIEKGVIQVWVMVSTPEASVKFPISTIEGQSHWHINGLPDITVYTFGIPLARDKNEQGLLQLHMDIGGKTIKGIQPPSMGSMELDQPMSFIMLDKYIIEYHLFTPVQLSQVVSITNQYLEDKDSGYYPVSSEFPVYLNENGHLTYQGNQALTSGLTSVTLYQSSDGLGRTAIINYTDPIYNTIRVILQNTQYNNLLHDEIRISSNGAFTAETLVDQLHFDFSQGDIIQFTASDQEVQLYKNGEKLASSKYRWYITSSGDAMLRVPNIQRNHARNANGTPYRGNLEIALYNQQLTLINEVLLEEYLYSVVPSEMPVSFGLEALKVQAIAARSYAIRSMISSGYRIYGAHVDDSTASQVYNNTVEPEIAIQAVMDTAGIVPFYRDEVVDARFFSTSSGYTANFHEVWSDRNQVFPAREIEYLTANPQYPGNTPSMYNEKNFRAFINQKDLPGYDRFSSFFRWNVTMSPKQLESSLQQNLTALQKTQSLFILTRSADGDYQSMEIPSDIGKLQALEVIKRGEGGNIMELEITTTSGVFKVIKEYNVRVVLKPVNTLAGSPPLELKCHDGTVRKNFPLLPSAFAYIDYTRDSDGNMEDITIFGGGYGHGVGMSQYGTYGLTLLGKSYNQIIEHYYPGSELVNIYTYRP